MKYRVNGVSAGGTFTPVPSGASAKATTYGMIHTYGQPGTKAVPSPKPVALPDGPLMRSAQPSYSAPDVFYPTIYFNRITNLQPVNGTIRVKSNNEMPVPAVPSNRVPNIAFAPARIGGARQITWPPAPQVWQSVNGGQS